MKFKDVPLQAYFEFVGPHASHYIGKKTGPRKYLYQHGPQWFEAKVGTINVEVELRPEIKEKDFIPPPC